MSELWKSAAPRETPAAIEKQARRVARILGPYSAAAKAIAEMERRRALGEAVNIYRGPEQWIVGP